MIHFLVIYELTVKCPMSTIDVCSPTCSFCLHIFTGILILFITRNGNKTACVDNGGQIILAMFQDVISSYPFFESNWPSFHVKTEMEMAWVGVGVFRYQDCHL